MSTLAMVGFTGSNLDLSITYTFAQWLDSIGVHITNLKPDVLDLSIKRDFLLEDKTYDYVVLMMIFRYSSDELDEFDREAQRFMPQLQVSKNHSVANWKARLISTKAKVIYIVGFDKIAEVSPGWLGDLPGYTLTRISDGDSVYTQHRGEEVERGNMALKSEEG